MVTSIYGLESVANIVATRFDYILSYKGNK